MKTKKRTMTSSSDFTKTLQPATLVVDAILLALCWAFQPQWIAPLAAGMLLGQLYLLTLRLNAQKPGSPYAQVAISLTRVAITAYAVVILANAQHHLRPALAAVLVIAGCFSYKWVVAIVALRHIRTHFILRGKPVNRYGTPSLDR